MAERIKGITVEIGGDTQGLDTALKGVNSTTFALQRELRDVQKLLKFDPDNVELLAQKQQLLSEQVEHTEKKLQSLRDVQEQVNEQFEKGEIGADQYRAFQREIASTESYLASLRSKLDNVDDSKAPKNAKDDIDKMGKAAERAKDSIEKMGRGLGTAAKGIAGAATAGAAGIGGLIIGTTDLNKELGRLRFNAFNEGFNVEGIEDDFKRIAAVTGETDSAVETLSNLMQTGFDQQQMSEAVDLVNGAYLRFSDTLKTEGIADGIQETFATGEAVGPFAELLERSGVSLDTFNAGLTAATAAGTETNFVLEQMRDIGLAGTAEGFKSFNSELMAQQEAQIGLQVALANLGLALTPLMTLITNFATKIAEWGLENVNLVTSFDSISEGIVALLPQLFGKGLELITTIVSAIVTNLPMIISTGSQILMQLIMGIIQMLPALIAQIQTLLPTVTAIVQQNLPMIISAGVSLLIALVNGIIQMMPQLIDTAIQLIVLIATELVNHLPEIVGAGVDLILALVKGLIKALPDIDKALTTIINAIIDALDGVDKKLREKGKEIIQGLIDGITKKAGEVMRAAGDIANGIARKIGSILKLGSPSRVLIAMGEDTGEGMKIGLQRSISSVTSAAANMGTSIVDSLTKFLGGGEVVSKYFKAIQEDGDWLNDWLTHMPRENRDIIMNVGKALAPKLEGTLLRQPQTSQNSLTVNLHSPKALDVREANKVFNRQLNKMTALW